MDKDIRLIRNILSRCEEIEEAICRFGDSEEDFKDDWMYQYVCSFCLLQIGENAGDLSSELTKKYPEIQWKDVRRTRDFVAHNYHNVDLNIVWRTVTESVPVLRETCLRILHELYSSDV
jgi:uncharacterized protein with HEPN domain